MVYDVQYEVLVQYAVRSCLFHPAIVLKKSRFKNKSDGGADTTSTRPPTAVVVRALLLAAVLLLGGGVEPPQQELST